MLGRGVAPVAESSPNELFAGIRFEVSSADLAMANLESPLTKRAHVSGPDALEAKPSFARLLGLAGFDAVTIANNHAGDAGPETVSDTMRALAAARIVVAGAGASREQALAARIVSAGGLRIALLAFDTTMEGPEPASGSPGIARWNERLARKAVQGARSRADIVVVALHGGAPYAPESDPYLMRLGRSLASWGADIVWAAGPHVVQPVRLVRPCSGLTRRTGCRCNESGQPDLRPAHSRHAKRSAARGAGRLRRRTRLPGRPYRRRGARELPRLEDAPLGRGGARRRLVDAGPPRPAR